MTKSEQVLRAALILARPLIEETLQQEIESYASPEKEKRVGSVRSSFGLKRFYNPDTINEVDVAQSVRRHKRVLKHIDAALNS